MMIAVFFERYGWSIAVVLVAVGDAVVPVAAVAADHDHDADEYSFVHWDDQMYDNRDM